MKVAIYCRLSEEDRDKRNSSDDSESIQNQKTMLVQFALQQEWDIFNIYSDDDYTGADRNRPAFNKLLSDAEAKKFDIVLCKTQSRFTRDFEYVEKYLHMLFPLWGIRFISVVDHADTAIKGNKKARQINGLINEWYLEDLSENIKSVLTARRKNGFHIGAFALYGYHKDPDKKGHLIMDEEAADIVREVFTLFAQGYGKTNIARTLNERGIPNPSEYKRMHGLRYMPAKTKSSTLWKYAAVAHMLRNEMYIGNMVQGKYASVSYKTQQNKPQPKEDWIIVKNTHEPIISMELWDRVQELIKRNTKPFITGTTGLFARKAKCMYCGYFMRSHKTRDRYYLECPTHHVSKNTCIGAFVSVKLLEQTVCNELKSLTSQYLDKDEAEQNIIIENDYQTRKIRILADIDLYEKKKTECEKAEKSLYLDKANGLITENEFLDMMRDFRKDIALCDSKRSDAQSRLELIENRMKSADTRQKLIESYTDVSQLSREMVDKLIDCIYVGKKDPNTKKIPVEIHWNF